MSSKLCAGRPVCWTGTPPGAGLPPPLTQSAPTHWRPCDERRDVPCACPPWMSGADRRRPPERPRVGRRASVCRRRDRQGMRTTRGRRTGRWRGRGLRAVPGDDRRLRRVGAADPEGRLRRSRDVEEVHAFADRCAEPRAVLHLSRSLQRPPLPRPPGSAGAQRMCAAPRLGAVVPRRVRRLARDARDRRRRGPLAEQRAVELVNVGGTQLAAGVHAREDQPQACPDLLSVTLQHVVARKGRQLLLQLAGRKADTPGGASRHIRPLRITYTMPDSTRRSSTRARPRDSGKYGSIRRICASLNSGSSPTDSASSTPPLNQLAASPARHLIGPEPSMVKFHGTSFPPPRFIWTPASNKDRSGFGAKAPLRTTFELVAWRSVRR